MPLAEFRLRLGQDLLGKRKPTEARLHSPHAQPVPVEVQSDGEHTVLNIPGMDLMEKVDYCGLVSGEKSDKSEVFDVFYGDLTNAPMIRECPLCMECRLVNAVDLPSNTLFIAEIINTYSEERYLTDGKPDIEKIHPFALTMPDNNYWKVGERAGKAWSIGRNFRRF